MSLVCTSTYDVEEHFLRSLLAEEHNTSILVQCAVIVHDGEHSQRCLHEHYLALLNLRYSHLLRRAHDSMSQHSAQIDHALQQLWCAYVPGNTGWTHVPDAGDHWLTTDTAPLRGTSMSVHYDLLSGELLVNGLPMNQPSKACRNQPLYATLFDRALVEVMPCLAPGLQFSTNRPFDGHAVRLGIYQAELLVEATKDGTTYETIPRRLVEAAFPVHFAHDFVHWFNASTKTVQFRPVGQPWDASSPDNWTLSTQAGQKNRFPESNKTDEHLLQRDNIRSATVRVSGFGAEDHTVRHDAVYAARDCESSSQCAVRAASMSNLLFRDAIALGDAMPAWGYLWQAIHSFGPTNLVYGPTSSVKPDQVKYDAILMRESQDHVLAQFPSLQAWLRDTHTRQHRKFSVAIWLSAMAAAKNAKIAVLQTLAMFSRSSALTEIEAPDIDLFRPSEGKTCSRNVLRGIVVSYRRTLYSCPEYNLPRHANERIKAYKKRCETAWQRASGVVIENFLDAIVVQWPVEHPQTPSVQTQDTYIDIAYAMEDIIRQFKTWQNNVQLDNYLESIEQALSGIQVQQIRLHMPETISPSETWRMPGYVAEHQIFQEPAPQLLATPPQLPYEQGQQIPGHPDALLLGPIIDTLKASSGRSKFAYKYVTDLNKSRDALVAQGSASSSCENLEIQDLVMYIQQCEQHAQKVYHTIESALSPSRVSLSAGFLDQWPRLSPTFFLKQLARKRWTKLPDDWKLCMVQYGLALATLQRAKRICALVSASRHEDFLKELQNPGHQTWDPVEHPETLLMEIESDILVRPVQEQIASKMRAPDGDNSVMQLNMGEGKSSCIVPMVVVALADSRTLVRVIVAKPQSQQMAQMLISKLGGLLDRRVYFMPISRSLKFDSPPHRRFETSSPTVWKRAV